MRLIHVVLLLASSVPSAALAGDNSSSPAYCVMEKSHFAETIKIQAARASASATNVPRAVTRILSSNNDNLNNAASIILGRRLSAADATYLCEFYSSALGEKVAAIQIRTLQTGQRESLTRAEHDVYAKFVSSDAYLNWNKLDFKGRSYLDEFMQELGE